MVLGLGLGWRAFWSQPEFVFNSAGKKEMFTSKRLFPIVFVCLPIAACFLLFFFLSVIELIFFASGQKSFSSQ